MSMIRDLALAPSGHRKIEWVSRNMPLLGILREEFARTQPFRGLRVVICVHVEAKTAYLAQVMAAGGAQVAVTGCNPLSTQDDVAAALVDSGIEVFTMHGESEEEYFNHLRAALDTRPQLFVDDGGDLLNLICTERQDLIDGILGGTEETTTGVIRLRAREADGLIPFPMIAVNDAFCKYLFDNRYGTGQSVWDGINRTTNLIVAGKRVVIAGYGWCGRGCAMRAKGLGAKVIVCEVNPVRAIEAHMDGFEVMTMDEAAPLGDFFVTLTGCEKVIGKRHFEAMKDGAILANAGHFDVEIVIPELAAMAEDVYPARNNIMTYRMKDGRRINLLAEGRLVNLAAGDGHPAEIMDMSFAVQALALRYAAENHASMEKRVYPVPPAIDDEVARLKLKTLGVSIDTLTEEQERYLKSWQV